MSGWLIVSPIIALGGSSPSIVYSCFSLGALLMVLSFLYSEMRLIVRWFVGGKTVSKFLVVILQSNLSLNFHVYLVLSHFALHWICGIESSHCHASASSPKTIFRSSKPKDHIVCLERRLPLWLHYDLDTLVTEGTVIQKRLQYSQYLSDHQQSVSCAFMKLMLVGKTREALQLLSSKGRGKLLNLSDPADPSFPKGEGCVIA